jgi:hypothetical protein
VIAWAAQSGASVRLEWGAVAIEQLAGDVDCVERLLHRVRGARDRGVAVFCARLRNRAATAQDRFVAA